MKTIIIAILIVLCSSIVNAECKTIMEDGKITTCCVYGNIIQCF